MPATGEDDASTGVVTALVKGAAVVGPGCDVTLSEGVLTGTGTSVPEGDVVKLGVADALAAGIDEMADSGAGEGTVVILAVADAAEIGTGITAGPDVLRTYDADVASLTGTGTTTLPDVLRA